MASQLTARGPRCRWWLSEVTQLKRFTKVLLQPDETTTVEFAFTVADLLFYGLGDENQSKYEAGWFQVRVGGLVARFELVLDE